MRSAIQAVGKTPPISFDRAAVVFDKTTGKILHIHRVTVAREHHPSLEDGELRHLALEAARRFLDDVKVAAADVLHVDPEELRRVFMEAKSGEAQMRVDVAGRHLSSEAKPSAARAKEVRRGSGARSRPAQD